MLISPATTIRETSPQTDSRAQPLRQVAAYALVSLIVLTPCFWHPRIEAGDLASHTYNAWLANLVQQGKAPGLQLETQTGNLLFDVLAQHLGAALGFPAAEKIVASLFVLCFFWGAFTLISVLANRHVWGVVPLLMMLTYSWTLQMGFMNFYASLALVFWGLSLWLSSKRPAGCCPWWQSLHGLPIPWERLCFLSRSS